MREYQQYPPISVVIPALNEAKNLRRVLPLIPLIVTEIILVDGHSTDDTIAVVQQPRPRHRMNHYLINDPSSGPEDIVL